MLSQARHKNVLHVQKSVIFFTLINLKKKIKIKRVTRELTDQTHLLTGDSCRLPKYRLAEFKSNLKQLNGAKKKKKLLKKAKTPLNLGHSPISHFTKHQECRLAC